MIDIATLGLDERNQEDFRQRYVALHEHGYVDIDEIKGIRVGSRVRHIGEQYYEALQGGTAEVLAITEHVNSRWSRGFGRRDVELLVKRDKPLAEGMTLIYGWADYHTIRIEEEEL